MSGLFQYALCSETFEDHSLADAAKPTAEIGYTGIDPAPDTLADQVTDILASDCDQIRKEVEDVGITAEGLHWLLTNTPL